MQSSSMHFSGLACPQTRSSSTQYARRHHFCRGCCYRSSLSLHRSGCYIVTLSHALLSLCPRCARCCCRSSSSLHRRYVALVATRYVVGLLHTLLPIYRFPSNIARHRRLSKPRSTMRAPECRSVGKGMFQPRLYKPLSQQTSADHKSFQVAAARSLEMGPIATAVLHRLSWTQSLHIMPQPLRDDDFIILFHCQSPGEASKCGGSIIVIVSSLLLC